MTHPSSLDLEAFACGEGIASVAGHIDECTACAAFVERVRGALSAGPSRTRAADAVARAAARVERSELAAPTSFVERARTKAARRWFMSASTVAIPLAAAAALLLFLRTPSATDMLPDAPIPASTEEPTTHATTEAPEPEISFKGGVQGAVIRDRAGQQIRFTGAVAVRPGDRLRVEIALDREQVILAAVLGEDESWLELMPESVRGPGTHFSERAARVDDSPLRGVILVGSPEAVARARITHRFDDVTTLRVEWEAP